MTFLVNLFLFSNFVCEGAASGNKKKQPFDNYLSVSDKDFIFLPTIRIDSNVFGRTLE
jgi:hypothetical protein